MSRQTLALTLMRSVFHHCSSVNTDAHKVARVLKPGGQWLYITYRQPHFLKPLLAREGVWTLQIETLEDAPGTFEYFGFIITKL